MEIIKKILLIAAVTCLTISTSEASWIGRLFGAPEVEAYWSSMETNWDSTSYYNLKNNGKTTIIITGYRERDGTVKKVPGMGIPLPPGYTMSLPLNFTPYTSLPNRPKKTWVTKDGDLDPPLTDRGFGGLIVGAEAAQNIAELEVYLRNNYNRGPNGEVLSPKTAESATAAAQPAPAPAAAMPAPEKPVAAKPAPQQKKPAYPADIKRPGFTVDGKPTCQKTKDGLIWTTHNAALPLTMTSKVPGLREMGAIDGHPDIFLARLEHGRIIIYCSPNEKKQTANECLTTFFPSPAGLPPAVKAAAYWRFADDSTAGNVARAVELVVDTRSQVDPIRVIGVGGIAFWADNSPESCGVAIILGLPNYDEFDEVMKNLTTPHSPGPSEKKLLETVQAIKETVDRMILEDMSVVQPAKT